MPIFARSIRSTPRWRNRQTRWSQTPMERSVPVRPRLWVQEEKNESSSLFFCCQAHSALRGALRAMGRCLSTQTCKHIMAQTSPQKLRFYLALIPYINSRRTHLNQRLRERKFVYCSTFSLRYKVFARVLRTSTPALGTRKPLQNNFYEGFSILPP